MLALEQRSDSLDDLVAIERLDEVVIRAELQPCQPVLHISAGREDVAIERTDVQRQQVLDVFIIISNQNQGPLGHGLRILLREPGQCLGARASRPHSFGGTSGRDARAPRQCVKFPRRIDWRTMIKFGTSGWRGIIGEDFTFSNVRIASQGITNYLKKSNL